MRSLDERSIRKQWDLSKIDMVEEKLKETVLASPGSVYLLKHEYRVTQYWMANVWAVKSMISSG